MLTLAADDLAAAKLLLKSSPRLAYYQLSQAAEKTARAIVEASGHVLRPTHVIANYAGLLAQDDPWRQRLAAFDPMSGASTATRYPSERGDLPRVPPDDVLRDWLAKVEALLTDARLDVERRLAKAQS